MECKIEIGQGFSFLKRGIMIFQENPTVHEDYPQGAQKPVPYAKKAFRAGRRFCLTPYMDLSMRYSIYQ